MTTVVTPFSGLVCDGEFVADDRLHHDEFLGLHNRDGDGEGVRFHEGSIIWQLELSLK